MESTFDKLKKLNPAFRRWNWIQVRFSSGLHLEKSI